MPVYDTVIVGAGIAGLATAELAARSGKLVALVERNEKVCAEASGAHHGWFHFGSLYSIFPNNQFMRTLVGGVDDLLDYYSGFPRLNLRIDHDGRLRLGTIPDAWIRDEPIQYVVAARNDPDFDLRRFDGIESYLRKLVFTLGWDLTIKQFISRHQRFHNFDWRTGPASLHVPRAGWLNYSREVIHKPTDFGCSVDRDTHFTVFGFDRPMNSGYIASDLLSSFLGNGGALLRNCTYKGYRRQGSSLEVETSSDTLHTQRLMLAAGRWLNDVCGPNLRTNVVASPLLVAHPHVCDINWARLTPFKTRTINHLKHYAHGSPYSLIGGGYLAAPEDASAVERSKEELLGTAERIFPRLRDAEFRHVYVSYKTEVVSKAGERNYQYFIRSIDENVYALIPGKFSLSFSLAVNAYRRMFGSEPSRTMRAIPTIDQTDMVYVPVHEQLVRDHLNSAARTHGIAASREGDAASLAPLNRFSNGVI